MVATEAAGQLGNLKFRTSPSLMITILGLPFFFVSHPELLTSVMYAIPAIYAYFTHYFRTRRFSSQLLPMSVSCIIV